MMSRRWLFGSMVGLGLISGGLSAQNRSVPSVRRALIAYGEPPYRLLSPTECIGAACLGGPNSFLVEYRTPPGNPPLGGSFTKLPWINCRDQNNQPTTCPSQVKAVDWDPTGQKAYILTGHSVPGAGCGEVWEADLTTITKRTPIIAPPGWLFEDLAVYNPSAGVLLVAIVSNPITVAPCCTGGAGRLEIYNLNGTLAVPGFASVANTPLLKVHVGDIFNLPNLMSVSQRGKYAAVISNFTNTSLFLWAVPPLSVTPFAPFFQVTWPCNSQARMSPHSVALAEFIPSCSPPVSEVVIGGRQCMAPSLLGLTYLEDSYSGVALPSFCSS